MSDLRPKLIVVCGPTATGKTDLAVNLAERFDGEIVNADSMQVYRYMDIGTAKPTPEERARASFHLIDVADPDDTFSAGRFKELADRAIAAMIEHGRLPIVAGGTGLYIKALTRGLVEGPSADPELRRRYKQQEEESPGSLHRRLQEIDPARAVEVNPADYVRIERSLEVFDLTGTPMSQWQSEHGFAELPYEVLQIGIHREKEDLAAACDTRVETMMASGWLNEVRQLRTRGYGPELPSQMAIGYKELHQFLDDRINLDEAVAQMKATTRKYAKRQRTWFGADETIHWVPTDIALPRAIEMTTSFLSM